MLFLGPESKGLIPPVKEHSNIEVGGARISVRIIRPDEPREQPWLVFLHHALGSIAQWKNFPLRLSQETGLPALVVERSGHGNSSGWPVKRGPDFFHVEALERLPGILKKLEIKNPILVGHSDGATIALLFASRFPAAGLLLEAPHIMVEPQTAEGIRQALAGRENLVARLAKYHGERSDALVNAWSEQWLDPAFQHWNITRELPAISCPVLVVQGTTDPYGTTAHAREIKKALGGKATCLFTEGGHFLHLEEAELVLKYMASFVRDQIENHSINIS